MGESAKRRRNTLNESLKQNLFKNRYVKCQEEGGFSISLNVREDFLVDRFSLGGRGNPERCGERFFYSGYKQIGPRTSCPVVDSRS